MQLIIRGHDAGLMSFDEHLYHPRVPSLISIVFSSLVIRAGIERTMRERINQIKTKGRSRLSEHVDCLMLLAIQEFVSAKG